MPRWGERRPRAAAGRSAAALNPGFRFDAASRSENRNEPGPRRPLGDQSRQPEEHAEALVHTVIGAGAVGQGLAVMCDAVAAADAEHERERITGLASHRQ